MNESFRRELMGKFEVVASPMCPVCKSTTVIKKKDVVVCHDECKKEYNLTTGKSKKLDKAPGNRRGINEARYQMGDYYDNRTE